jgi:hypothetical protein
MYILKLFLEHVIFESGFLFVFDFVAKITNLEIKVIIFVNLLYFFYYLILD